MQNVYITPVFLVFFVVSSKSVINRIYRKMNKNTILFSYVNVKNKVSTFWVSAIYVTFNDFITQFFFFMQ